MTQSKLFKFKTILEELQYKRNILYIDLLQEIKRLDIRKIEICKSYQEQVKDIDYYIAKETKAIKCKKK